MRDRIIRFLSSENKTSAQFAEEIGIQPSGVSHIISGRNNPSLDFVLKMLRRYTYISPEWLLFGTEPMYRTNVNPTLFDFDTVQSEDPVESSLSDDVASPAADPPVASPALAGQAVTAGSAGDPATITERIIIFYSDRTFAEYVPGKK